MTGDFNRKSAFAIKIVDPDTGKPPEGQPRLIQLDNSMYVFFGDSIFQIFPPELIDPENTAPDTRPAYQRYMPWDLGIHGSPGRLYKRTKCSFLPFCGKG